MKNELVKQFIKKTAVKIILFTVMMFIIAGLMQPVGVVISNELALTQMENSNEMFVIMNTYNKVRSIVSVAFAGITLWFTSTIARDIYKFVKTIENKKEN